MIFFTAPWRRQYKMSIEWRQHSLSVRISRKQSGDFTEGFEGPMKSNDLSRNTIESAISYSHMPCPLLRNARDTSRDSEAAILHNLLFEGLASDVVQPR